MSSKNGSNGPLLNLSENANTILSQHSHLDLTDDIELVDPLIRGCGGFSDVYYGRFIKDGTYVAIKRLRVHIQKERKLSMASKNIWFTNLRSVLNSAEHFSRAPNMVFP